MTLEQLSLVAQIVSAVAVIASLIFAGVQLRQATAAIRASSSEAQRLSMLSWYTASSTMRTLHVSGQEASRIQRVCPTKNGCGSLLTRAPCSANMKHQGSNGFEAGLTMSIGARSKTRRQSSGTSRGSGPRGNCAATGTRLTSGLGSRALSLTTRRTHTSADDLIRLCD